MSVLPWQACLLFWWRVDKVVKYKSKENKDWWVGCFFRPNKIRKRCKHGIEVPKWNSGGFHGLFTIRVCNQPSALLEIHFAKVVAWKVNTLWMLVGGRHYVLDMTVSTYVGTSGLPGFDPRLSPPPLSNRSNSVSVRIWARQKEHIQGNWEGFSKGTLHCGKDRSKEASEGLTT